jgi:hypothetical protein
MSIAAGLNDDAAHFDPAQNSEWNLVTTTGNISGWTGNNITLDLGQFTNSYSGSFSLDVGTTNIDLVYTAASVPEPSETAAMAALGALGTAFWLRRRRD